MQLFKQTTIYLLSTLTVEVYMLILYANSIREYLGQLKKIYIIAISETSINTEKCVDFEIDGYKLNYANRVKRSGGGVMNYKVVESMTTVVDDLLLCITVEILHVWKRQKIF